ncbi:tRNA lysidine(34) synthetase TilS [Allorhizobium undicola]|uniref:tRNA lysidine(34) synthetase TilS n=1 Tax=Allorhizobium undicola TaxID=78527 RepID=UPI00068754F1|nr:tRNA lysidine(34) synthetase TilS [Allorhizobium undicola]
MSAPRATGPEPAFPPIPQPDRSDALAALGGFLERVPAGSRLLLAVSGGSDSLGLLLGLVHLLRQPRFGDKSISLATATIDHGLRPEAAEEAAFVGRIAASHGIAHFIRRWEGDKPQSGLSAAAREARYDLLADLAAECGADAILTGHTANDQAETIAMRAKRLKDSLDVDATGLSGMAASLLFDSRVWIYRPLLAVTRGAIRSLLEHRGQNWVEDPSNSNPAYERARLRLAGADHLPLPLPEPGLGAGRSNVMQEAARLCTAFFDMPWPFLGNVAIAAFHDQPSALRALLSPLLACFGGQAYGPGAAGLNAILTLAGKPPGQRLTVGGCLLHRHSGGIFIVRERRNLPQLSLLPGERGLWDGRFVVQNEDRFAVTIGAGLFDGNGKAGFPSATIRQKEPEGFSTMPGLRAPSTSVLPEISGEITPRLPRSLVKLAADTLPACGKNQVFWPVLAPYRRFLPGFDLPLASALARKFGLAPFPAAPF